MDAKHGVVEAGEKEGRVVGNLAVKGMRTVLIEDLPNIYFKKSKQIENY